MSQHHSSPAFSRDHPEHDASHLTLQDKLVARRAQRAAKAAERRQQSEAFKEEGNVFFRNGNYGRAVDRYQQAIHVHGDAIKPVLLTNLAAAYHHLGRFVDAHEAADKALFADPKSVKARYRRAMARKCMESYTAAAIDLRVILRLDPRYSQDIKEELAYVEKCRRKNWLMEEEYGDRESEDEMPAPDDDPEPGESLSESSNCEHAGNGKPCKWYNRGECTRGRACLFSHAPDDQSKRDALGRNVCRYYLMGLCKLGSERCAYLHSKEYLLQNGWWSTAEGVNKAKGTYKVQQLFKKAAIDYEKQNKAPLGPEEGQASQTRQKKHLGGKDNRDQHARLNVRGVTADAGRLQSAHAVSGQPSQKKNSRGETKRTINSVASVEENGLDDGNSEYGAFGFTSNDMEELLCHGVKPWDDDAQDFLEALHGAYREIDAAGEEGEQHVSDGRVPGGSGSTVATASGGSQSSHNVPGRTSRKKNAKKKKKPTVPSGPSQGGYDPDRELSMCGSADGEVEELLCYGVKPYEDDARDFLDTVHSWPR